MRPIEAMSPHCVTSCRQLTDIPYEVIELHVKKIEWLRERSFDRAQRWPFPHTVVSAYNSHYQVIFSLSPWPAKPTDDPFYIILFSHLATGVCDDVMIWSMSFQLCEGVVTQMMRSYDWPILHDPHITQASPILSTERWMVSFLVDSGRLSDWTSPVQLFCKIYEIRFIQLAQP